MLEPIRRRLAPATARTLLREAGPPTLWVAAALAVAGFVGAALEVMDVRAPLIAAIVLLIVTVPSVIDRTGWRIRLGMAWLGAEQRRRSSSPMPRTPAGAERRLDRSEGIDSPFHRVSMLLIAGRMEALPEAIAGLPRHSAEDVARATRFEAAYQGLQTGRFDATAARDAIAALPVESRLYHEISLAWTTAWIAAANKQPWRASFAHASRGVSARGIPARFLVWMGTQELLATIVVAMLLIVLFLAGWR